MLHRADEEAQRKKEMEAAKSAETQEKKEEKKKKKKRKKKRKGALRHARSSYFVARPTHRPKIKLGRTHLVMTLRHMSASDLRLKEDEAEKLLPYKLNPRPAPSAASPASPSPEKPLSARSPVGPSSPNGKPIPRRRRSRRRVKPLSNKGTM